MNRIINRTIAATVALIFLIPFETVYGKEPADTSSNGFTLVSEQDFSSYDATVFVYEHDLTGAKVEFIQNDDPNKFFMMEFETCVNDNRGTAHVFEHSAMNGSVKYPSRSLSSALFNRGYITYANALTSDKCTVYPIASLSEKQLLVLADYYADACFEPMILKDEDIFRSEAWRYALADADDDLKINGTIYSEMQSAYTPQMAALRNAIGLVAPGHASSYEAGGIPSEILKLSYEDVVAYHDMYYHPANSITYLYGDIKDADAFLDLLDGYFTKFSNGSFAAKTSRKRTEEKYTVKYYDFPAQKDASGDLSQIVYAFDLGLPDNEELEELYAFNKLINMDSSNIMMTLRAKFPSSTFSFALESDDVSTILTVAARNMGKDDADNFKDTVVECFTHMAKEGAKEAELENLKQKILGEHALCREGKNAAFSLLSAIADLYSSGRGELFYIDMYDRFLDMSWFDNDDIKSLSQKICNASSAMAVVTLKPGLYEENEKKLSDDLKKKKDKMTQKQLNGLISDNERIAAGSKDDPTEYLDKLLVTKVSDLTDNIQYHAIKDKTDDRGVRHINVYTKNDKADAAYIFLDASAVPKKLLMHLAFYTDLVNGHFVPTRSVSRNDLAGAINGATFDGQEISLEVSSYADDYTPYVTVKFTSPCDKTEDAYELAYERLYESSFDRPDVLREAARSIKNVIRNNINARPDKVARLIGYAQSDGAAYYESTHYLEYLTFLEEVEKMPDEELSDVSGKLAEVAALLNGAEGAVIGKASSVDNMKSCEDAANLFEKKLGKIPAQAKSVKDYDLPGYELPAAIITDSQLVYNTANIADEGLVPDDPLCELGLLIMDEVYLTPMIRGRYGAYRCSYSYSYPALSLYSGDDPTVKETYDTFAGMYDAWTDIRKNITKSAFDEYILRLHSSMAQRGGDISDAMETINAMAAGRNAYDRSIKARSLKKVTSGDLSKLDTVFEKLSQNTSAVSAGSGDLIQKNRDMFKTVISPFAK